MHPAGVGVSGNWMSWVRLFWGLHGMTSQGRGRGHKMLMGCGLFQEKKNLDAGKTKEKNPYINLI